MLLIIYRIYNFKKKSACKKFYESDYLLFCTRYSNVSVVRPAMLLIISGLNIERFILMRPIYIGKYILVVKQLVLIV